MGKRQISPERKAIYYGGMGVMALGFLLFISNFFIGPFPRGGHMGSHMGGPAFGADPFSGMNWMAGRAVGGIVLLMVGGLMTNIGARGAAGSGLVLDPEKAREDLEPWARTAGGLVKDALDEVRPGVGLGETQQLVKVRCPKCRALNDEDARFCKGCGAEL